MPKKLTTLAANQLQDVDEIYVENEKGLSHLITYSFEKYEKCLNLGQHLLKKYWKTLMFDSKGGYVLCVLIVTSRGVHVLRYSKIVVVHETSPLARKIKRFKLEKFEGDIPGCLYSNFKCDECDIKLYTVTKTEGVYDNGIFDPSTWPFCEIKCRKRLNIWHLPMCEQLQNYFSNSKLEDLLCHSCELSMFRYIKSCSAYYDHLQQECFNFFCTQCKCKLNNEWFVVEKYQKYHCNFKIVDIHNFDIDRVSI
jgi:hypothetical protein